MFKYDAKLLILAITARRERECLSFLSTWVSIFMNSVLARVSLVVIKHHDPKQSVEGRVYSFYTSISWPIVKGSQGRNPSKTRVWRQKLTWGPRRNATTLTCFLWLLSLFSYSTQDQKSSSGTTHRELGPPASVINQEDAPQAWPQADLAFSQLRNDSSLCWVDLKLASTPWFESWNATL